MPDPGVRLGTHLVVHPLDDILWTLQGEYEVLGSF
jgi:hypothetical protein